MEKLRETQLEQPKGELAQQVNFLVELADLLVKKVDTLSPKIDIMVEEGVDFKKEVKNLEVKLIEKALIHTKGNQKKAAKLLNLKVTTLHSKIKTLGIWGIHSNKQKAMN